MAVLWGVGPRGRAGESPPSASPSPPLPRRARQPPSLLLATTGTEAAVREPGGRCWFPAQFVHFFFTRHSFPHGRRAPAPCRLCPGAGDAMPVRGFPPWGGSWPSGDPRTWLRCGVRGGDASIPGTLGWVFSRVSDLTRICVSWPSGTRRHSRHFFFFFVTHDMAITPAFFGAADWEPAGRAGLCGGGGHPALRGLRAGVTSFAWSTRVWSGERHGGQAMELSPQFEELPLAWGRTAVTSLIQQILVEYLLCARHRSKCGDAAGNKTGRNLCLRADDILVGSGKGRGGRGSR